MCFFRITFLSLHSSPTLIFDWFNLVCCKGVLQPTCNNGPVGLGKLYCAIVEIAAHDFCHMPSLRLAPLQIGSQEYQIKHHPNAKKHCKQIVELARCERVMTTRAEFHFSWVYAFSATPRSLRIWATHPPRETGCDPTPPAQLCWSSSSSFPHICTTTSWNWTVTKLI